MIILYFPTEVYTSFAIFNLIACTVLVIIRVWHHQKHKIELKLSATGLSCMLFAVLCCLGLVNSQSEWYFGALRWCELSFKLNGLTYTMFRVLLYTFIIFRLEVMNQANFISSRIITVGKVIVVMTAVMMVIAATVFTEGVPDEHFGCGFEMNSAILMTIGVIDIFTCFGGTWIFLHPLRQTLKNIECDSLRRLVERTTFWSIVSLMTTLIGLLTITLIDGSGGVVGFDCSITSFSLVMMMSPESRKTVTKSHSNSKQDGRSVEILQIKSDVQERLSSGYEV